MDLELDQLKQSIDIIALAQSYNLSLKRQGRNWLAKCPFHADQTASLSFTPSKGLYHCFGCNAAGSVIDLVIQIEGISLAKAIEKLKVMVPSYETKPKQKSNIEKVGKSENMYDMEDNVSNSTTEDRQESSTKPKLELSQEELTKLRKMYVKLCNEEIMSSEEATNYLIKRGLFSESLIKEFELGYVERFGHPYREITSSSSDARDKFTQAGILRDTLQEHLAGSVIVPIYNEDEELVQIYGRRTKSYGAILVKHMYLPSKLQGIFNLQGITGKKAILLCEAVFDAMSFWLAGFKAVTCSFGVNGFTDEMLDFYQKQDTKVVVLAYDPDPAGEKATMERANQLKAVGIGCFKLRFPNGLDANSFSTKYLPANDQFAKLIESAVWLGDGRAPSLDLVATLRDPGQEKVKIFSLAEEKKVFPSVGKPLAESTLRKPVEPEQPKLKTHQPLETPVVIQTSSDLTKEFSSPKENTNNIKNDNINNNTALGEEIFIDIGNREYRIRAWKKNTAIGHMKINLRMTVGRQFHSDTLDLCVHRQRQEFAKFAAKIASTKFEVIEQDLGIILDKLESIQAQYILELVEKKKPKAPPMTAFEQEQAIDFLKSPNPIEKLLADFHRCGVVGEESNLLMCYMAATSRKLDKPLGILIQSSSAAGKSQLMEAVLSFMPKEEVIKYSAVTGQSLFYFNQTSVQHKILAIAEEEGARKASYSLKLLQSEGSLSIASAGKDPNTGKMRTEEYQVEGPVCLFSTTTASNLDEELVNRCIILSVNEQRQQTQAIHQQQRKLQSDIWAKEQRSDIEKLHQNAQRLLRSLYVKNPFAKNLTFLDDKTRTRRDHQKYLTLINSIALFHQYQREIKFETRFGKTKEYIEVALSDIELANKLANEILGHSLDELMPQTRKFLLQLDKMIKDFSQKENIARADYRFTQKQVRDYTGFGNTQVKIHLQRLVDYEYVITHRSGKAQQFLYELIYDGEGLDGTTFLPGLIDTSKLSAEKNEATSSEEPLVEIIDQIKPVGVKS